MKVYAIKNTVNGKVYVGSSINFEKRKREHLNDLRKKQHHNIHLQKSWNKYGETNFEFVILEIVNDPSLIRIKEKEWMDKTGALHRDNGFNMSESTTNFSASGKDHPLFGVRFSETGRVSYWKGKKMPEHLRAKMRKPRSEQSRRNMSLNHADVSGENNPMFGKTFTEEHRNKISKALAGRKLSDDHREKLKGRTGVKSHRSRKVVQLTPAGEYIQTHVNITIAAKESGAVRQCISKCCKGKAKTTGGFKWMYLTEYEKMQALI